MITIECMTLIGLTLDIMTHIFKRHRCSFWEMLANISCTLVYCSMSWGFRSIRNLWFLLCASETLSWVCLTCGCHSEGMGLTIPLTLTRLGSSLVGRMNIRSYQVFKGSAFTQLVICTTMCPFIGFTYILKTRSIYGNFSTIFCTH